MFGPIDPDAPTLKLTWRSVSALSAMPPLDGQPLQTGEAFPVIKLELIVKDDLGHDRHEPRLFRLDTGCAASIMPAAWFAGREACLGTRSAPVRMNTVAGRDTGTGRFVRVPVRWAPADPDPIPIEFLLSEQLDEKTQYGLLALRDVSLHFRIQPEEPASLDLVNGVPLRLGRWRLIRRDS